MSAAPATSTAASDDADARRDQRRDRQRRIGSQAAAGLLVLAVWVWASRPDQVSPLLLPTPESVARQLPELLSRGRTWGHLGITALEVVAAFCVSIVTGFALGFWSGRSAWRTQLIEPLLLSGYMVPIVLLYPIVLLIFGIGPSSKIAFAGLYGFFPVALNTMKGFRTVDQRLIRAATSMGVGKRQMVSLVLLPAAKPLVLSGIRIAAALNLIGVIVGEMLGSRRGLGYEIARTTSTFSIPQLYAYIVVALVLIVVFNRLVTRSDDTQRGRLDI